MMLAINVILCLCIRHEKVDDSSLGGSIYNINIVFCFKGE